MAEFIIQCEADKQEALRMIADYDRRTGRQTESPDDDASHIVDSLPSTVKTEEDLAEWLAESPSANVAEPEKADTSRTGRNRGSSPGLSL